MGRVEDKKFVKVWNIRSLKARLTFTLLPRRRRRRRRMSLIFPTHLYLINLNSFLTHSPSNPSNIPPRFAAFKKVASHKQPWKIMGSGSIFWWPPKTWAANQLLGASPNPTQPLYFLYRFKSLIAIIIIIYIYIIFGVISHVHDLYFQECCIIRACKPGERLGCFTLSFPPIITNLFKIAYKYIYFFEKYIWFLKNIYISKFWFPQRYKSFAYFFLRRRKWRLFWMRQNFWLCESYTSFSLLWFSKSCVNIGWFEKFVT